MYRVILSAVLALTVSTVANAIAMRDREAMSVHANLDFLAIQGPALARDERIAYQASLRLPFPGVDFLRIDSAFIAAPDPEDKSKRVTVDQDFYSLAPTIAAEYVNLFRFSAGIGPIFHYERTEIGIGATTQHSSFSDMGYVLRGDIDYAFSKDIEANLTAAWSTREKDDKSDWLYGFGLGYNF